MSIAHLHHNADESCRGGFACCILTTTISLGGQATGHNSRAVPDAQLVLLILPLFLKAAGQRLLILQCFLQLRLQVRGLLQILFVQTNCSHLLLHTVQLSLCSIDQVELQRQAAAVQLVARIVRCKNTTVAIGKS